MEPVKSTRLSKKIAEESASLLQLTGEPPAASGVLLNRFYRTSDAGAKILYVEIFSIITGRGLSFGYRYDIAGRKLPGYAVYNTVGDYLCGRPEENLTEQVQPLTSPLLLAAEPKPKKQKKLVTPSPAPSLFGD